MAALGAQASARRGAMVGAFGLKPRGGFKTHLPGWLVG